MRALECSGPGALVAVRQQQRQAAGLAPLRLAGDDEAVDDHLGGVGEVAELRLPEDERVRRRRRVAVLEAEAGDLRERAVVELEGSRRLLQVLDRRVLEAGVLVVEDEVAVGEGAALGVLAGEADVDALGQQRAEGERLGVAEVDPALLQRLGPFAERAAQLAVDGEALRASAAAPRSACAACSAGTQVSTGGLALRSSSSPVLVVTPVTVGSSYSPASIFSPQVLQRGRHLLVALARPPASTSSAVATPFADQLLGVDLGDRLVGLDLPPPSSAACRRARRSRCGRSGGSR